MEADKKKTENAKYLEQIKRKMFPDRLTPTVLTGAAITFVVLLGLSGFPEDERKEEEVLQQTQETVDDTVHKNVVNAYPGPPRFETPYERQITESARRYGLEEKLIEGMMIASSEENSRYRDIPEEYRSIILLDPERAGVLSRYLRSDPELAIEQAARLYASIRARESDEAKAIATFFAGREDVEKAVQEERTRLDEVYEQVYVYERLFSLMKPQLIKEKGLNWIGNLAPWQREATYIALTFVEMH